MEQKHKQSIDFDALGNECKKFESILDIKLIPSLPVIARLDGRAFHSFTKEIKAERPYDLDFIQCMERTTVALIKDYSVDIAYTQSDEITLVWLNLDLFDLRIQKLCSSLAASASVEFENESRHLFSYDTYPKFDCRIWNVPGYSEIIKTLIWRELDASKNSISMAAHSIFSNKELEGKTSNQRIQMMEDKGFHWSKLENRLKRGSFFKKVTRFKTLTEEEREKIPATHRPDENQIFARKVIERMNWPKLLSIRNLEDVLFNDGIEIIMNE